MNAEALKILGELRTARRMQAARDAESTGPKLYTERGRPVTLAEVARFAKGNCRSCGGTGQRVARVAPVRVTSENYTGKDGKQHTRTVRTPMPIVNGPGDGRAARPCGCGVSRFLKKHATDTILGGDEQLHWRKGKEPEGPAPAVAEAPAEPVAGP